MIVEIVARHYGTTPEAMHARCRRDPMLSARHIAMDLIRRRLGWSGIRVGNYFDGRAHNVVDNAQENVENRCQTEPEYARIYKAITSEIEAIKEEAI